MPNSLWKNSFVVTFPTGVSPLDPRRNLKLKGKKETEMNKLMKMATVVVSVGAMLGFAGCGSKGPDQVALDVLKTMQEGKAEQAFLEKNCTKETAGVFAMFGGMMKDATKGATWTATQTYIDDDIATVMIKQDGGEKPGEEAYYLKKIDGQWKLHMDKEHPGRDCIGTRTRNNAKHVLEILLTKYDESELKKYCTAELVADLKKEFSKDPTAEEAKQRMMAKNSLKVSGSEINKWHLDEGTIIFSFKAGDKDAELPVTVKRINGEWKVSGIKD